MNWLGKQKELDRVSKAVRSQRMTLKTILFFNVSSLNKKSCQTESSCQDHLLLTLLLKNLLRVELQRRQHLVSGTQRKGRFKLTQQQALKIIKALKMSKTLCKYAFPNASNRKFEGVREGFSCKQSAHLITRWLICQLFSLSEKSWQPSMSFSFSPTTKGHLTKLH